MGSSHPITLYHGSEHIVREPKLGLGKPYNDYGRGFYCTRELDMACEWACKQGGSGFANRYELDCSDLLVLDLNDGTHTVLHWIALLLANRTFSLSSAIAEQSRTFILDQFLIDTSKFDLIVGYRADDSYFSFAEAFVENSLPIRRLEEALRLGDLGEQVVLISEAAFNRIRFIDAQPADAATFYPRFKQRDIAARNAYRSEVRSAPDLENDVFVLDLMRKAGKR